LEQEGDLLAALLEVVGGGQGVEDPAEGLLSVVGVGQD
jgi:hypothetical protein